MRKLGALGWLVVCAAACAQAPCTSAPKTSSTSFFAEPVATRPSDSLVIVRLCLASTERIGSYMASVTFDSSHMRVARVDARAGMQATNARTPGIVRVAGAAPSGFPNGELLRIAFTSAEQSLDRISIVVSEANSTSGVSILGETDIAGWPRDSQSASAPVIDSISPQDGELEDDRVTDITIYGSGFAALGNLVVFGSAQVPGLRSEAEGTIIRFPAPGIRVADGKALIRVKHNGMESNAVSFTVKGDRP
jgi:hypothetical protein